MKTELFQSPGVKGSLRLFKILVIESNDSCALRSAVLDKLCNLERQREREKKRERRERERVR